MGKFVQAKIEVQTEEVTRLETEVERLNTQLLEKNKRNRGFTLKLNGILRTYKEALLKKKQRDLLLKFKNSQKVS